MNKTRHIGLHAIKVISHSMRSGSGVAFIFLTILIGLSLANLVVTPIELELITVEELQDSSARAIGIALATATLRASDGDDNQGTLTSRMENGDLIDLGMWARYLVIENPVLLSITVLLLGVVLPLLLPLGSFTVISGDVQHRTVRYLLPRTSRSSILIGRWLGSMILAWSLIIFLLCSVVIYLSIMIPSESLEDLIPWAGRCFLALFFLTIPYVSLGILCSATFSVPMVALLATVGSTIGVPSLSLSLQEAWEPLGNLLYLLPWGYSHELLSPTTHKVVEASAYCLLHGLLFLILALLKFRRADL
ncbi:MAG: ABC transporter permease subunit [Planctomycetia bacterium]|nr:ABC transporter permease subunit [Planctomycetia bacterium]